MLQSKGTENKKIGKKDLLCLALIIAYALFFCFYQIKNNIYPDYYSHGDDATYPYFAQQFLQGTFRESNFIFSLRILQILPIAFFYKLFGISYYSAAAWNILSFICSIVTIFLIGKELYNKKTGFIASLLFTFFPMTAVFAYTIKPIEPLIFISLLALFALIKCQKYKSKTWGFVFGVLLIALPLIETIGAVLTLIGVLYLLVDQIYKRDISTPIKLYIVYGALLAVGLTCLFNYIFSGNPIITLTATESYYGSVGCNTANEANANITLYQEFGIPVACSNNIASSQYTAVCLTCYARIMFPYHINGFLTFLEQLLYSTALGGLFFYAAIFAIGYILFKRERIAYYFIFWFAFGLLYLNFGPMHIGLFPLSYLPITVLWYYLTIIAVPTILIISIALARFMDGGSQKIATVRSFIVLAIILLLIVTSLHTDYFYFPTF